MNNTQFEYRVYNGTSPENKLTAHVGEQGKHERVSLWVTFSLFVSLSLSVSLCLSVSLLYVSLCLSRSLLSLLSYLSFLLPQQAPCTPTRDLLALLLAGALSSPISGKKRTKRQKQSE